MNDLVTFDKAHDITIIRFYFNEIDLHQRSEIKDIVYGLLGKGEKKFIFDFSKTGFISSFVIATVISFYKELRSHGGQLKVCSLSPEARGVMKLTKLDEIIKVYDTEWDAICSYRE